MVTKTKVLTRAALNPALFVQIPLTRTVNANSSDSRTLLIRPVPILDPIAAFGNRGSTRHHIRFEMLIVALVGLLLALGFVGGCSDGEAEKQMVELARETVTIQARQNESLTAANHEIAVASKELVSKDAESRLDFIAVLDSIQTERGEVSRQQERVAAEWKNIQEAQRRDSLAAASIGLLGQAVLCSIPLLLIGWMLYFAYSPSREQDLLADASIEQLVLQFPILLSPPTSDPAVPTRLTNLVGNLPRVGLSQND